MTFSAGALRGGDGARPGTIDHRLARQHLINEYRRGRLRRDQVCDAHPELLRAAENVGTPTTTACPICEDCSLRLVTYVFGPRLPKHGRCVSTRAEVEQFNRRREEFAAYVVEACCGCRWHHLLRVMPLGGRQRRAAGE